MIKGFETQTEKLTTEERKAAELIKAALEHVFARDGDKSAVSNATLSKWLLSHHGLKIKGARMRKIMNWARVTGFIECVGADSKGYWISHNRNDQISYVQSLNGRIEAIYAIRNAYMEQCGLQPKDIPPND